MEDFTALLPHMLIQNGIATLVFPSILLTFLWQSLPPKMCCLGQFWRDGHYLIIFMLSPAKAKYIGVNLTPLGIGMNAAIAGGEMASTAHMAASRH